MGDRPSLRCSFLRSCDLALLNLSCTTRRYIQLPPPMPQAQHITGSPPSRPGKSNITRCCAVERLHWFGMTTATDPGPRSRHAKPLRHRPCHRFTARGIERFHAESQGGKEKQRLRNRVVRKKRLRTLGDNHLLLRRGNHGKVQ